MGTQKTALTWAGWAIAGLIGLLMVFGATMAFRNPPEVAEQVVGKFGYPQDFIPILGIVELGCVVLYLVPGTAVPGTAVLGAVLLTGYLGGAVATHVRVHDNFIMPVVVGVFVWLGLYLRDPRIRALLPLCRPLTPSDSNAKAESTGNG